MLWLKTNNPKYYGDIEIDDGRLQQLPEDDVPDEILASARQEEDAEIIQVENDTYVPLDEDVNDGTLFADIRCVR